MPNALSQNPISSTVNIIGEYRLQVAALMQDAHDLHRRRSDLEKDHIGMDEHRSHTRHQFVTRSARERPRARSFGCPPDLTKISFPQVWRRPLTSNTLKYQRDPAQLRLLSSWRRNLPTASEFAQMTRYELRVGHMKTLTVACPNRLSPRSKLNRAVANCRSPTLCANA
jgi:hypothetical protein